MGMAAGAMAIVMAALYCFALSIIISVMGKLLVTISIELPGLVESMRGGMGGAGDNQGSHGASIGHGRDRAVIWFACHGGARND